MLARRVLLVDDHPVFRTGLRRVLEATGRYEIVGEAGNAHEAIRVAEETRPGLILLDLNMPRKDGREALREIKADPALKHIPVVVLTTSKAEEDIYRTYNLGVNSFITKPVTFEGLVSVMRALGRYWFEIVELPPSEMGQPR